MSSCVAATADDDSDVIQPPTRLLDSVLWRMQTDFYDSSGSTAWSSGAVPSWITTNAYTAREYATLLLHAWRDMMDCGAMTPASRIVILEVGAGTARFACNLLTELVERCATARVLKSNIMYVATDFTSSNIEAWLSSPRLQALVASGNLDYGLLDASHAALDLNRIPLWHAGAALELGSSPLFVVCNYVLDSLPCDAFQVVKPVGMQGPGGLREVQLRLRSRSSRDAATCNDLNLEWVPAHDLNAFPTQYYTRDGLEPAHAALDAALDWYREHACDHSLSTAFQVDLATAAHSPSYLSVADLNPTAATSPADVDDPVETAMFPLPVAAFRLLSALHAATSKHGFMLLALDKGIASPAAYTRSHTIDVQQHGSVSFMLNFHALLLWARTTPHAFGYVSRSDDVNLKLACVGGFPNGVAPSTHMPLFMDTFSSQCSFNASEFYDLQAAVCGAAAATATSAGAAVAAAATTVNAGDADSDDEDDVGSGGISVRAAVALCALSAWDADVYHGVRSVLEPRFRFLSPPRRATIMRGLSHMCARWCDDTREGADPAFEGARMLQCGREFAGAARMYAQSLARAPHHAAAFNLGVCAMEMGVLDTAVQAFSMAMSLHPGGEGAYELAAEMRARAVAQRERGDGAIAGSDA